jgi:uncharacterized protein (DUF2236 family)
VSSHFAGRPVSIRVNAERIVLTGWTRAILMQVAHPLIAAGVVRHSSFRDNPVASARRLHHTVRAMLGLTFGDATTHARVIEGIRAIHRRVRGQLTEAVGVFPAGTWYSAEDPALLLWVHATLIESVLVAYDALVAPVSIADCDSYCVEAAGVAVELGAVADEVPRSWSALGRYLADVQQSGAIAVGADAREVATVLLRGRFSALLGPVAWANKTLTAGWLPPDLRVQYALDWNETAERHFARSVATLRRARRTLPDVVALWPESRRGHV